MFEVSRGIQLPAVKCDDGRCITGAVSLVTKHVSHLMGYNTTTVLYCNNIRYMIILFKWKNCDFTQKKRFKGVV